MLKGSRWQSCNKMKKCYKDFTCGYGSSDVKSFPIRYPPFSIYLKYAYEKQKYPHTLSLSRTNPKPHLTEIESQNLHSNRSFSLVSLLFLLILAEIEPFSLIQEIYIWTLLNSFTNISLSVTNEVAGPVLGSWGCWWHIQQQQGSCSSGFQTQKP
jgi:hypothetical protein